MVAKPREFSGGKDYRDFRRECLLYIQASRRAFPDSTSKILFVLSYMKSGTASSWAATYATTRVQADGSIGMTQTFAEFLASLDRSFDDPSRKANAIQRLRELRQGRDTADVFFQHFDILRTDAEMTDPLHDAMLIDMLERAVSFEVVKQVTMVDQRPTTYQAWKEAAIKFDQVQQRLHDVEQKRRMPFVPRVNVPATRQQPQFQQRPVQPPPPPQQRHDADFQGVRPGTHPGMGIPMDVSINNARRDRLCFICGQPGHFARNCPQSAQKIRRIIEVMDPSVRRVFAEGLNELKESEFLEADEAAEEEVLADEESFMNGQA